MIFINLKEENMEVKTQRNNDIYLYKEFLKGNNEAFNEIIKIYRKKLIY